MKTMATDRKAGSRRFKVLLDWDTDEQVWVTYVPTLGQLSTYGETRDEALEQTRQAIVGYLEAAIKEGLPIPPADAETEVVDLEIAGALTRLPRTSGKRILRALERAGFEETHVRGSHHYLRKAGGDARTLIWLGGSGPASVCLGAP